MVFVVSAFLTEGYTLMAFENRILMTIFGPEVDY
jgi:hypothetical protein